MFCGEGWGVMAFGNCPFCGSDIKGISQLGLDLIKVEWQCSAWIAQAMAPDTWKGEPNKGGSCEVIASLKSKIQSALDVIGENGCDCDYPESGEEHTCLGGRIERAITGKDRKP